jgi:hypothetical protein
VTKSTSERRHFAWRGGVKSSPWQAAFLLKVAGDVCGGNFHETGTSIFASALRPKWAAAVKITNPFRQSQRSKRFSKAF